MHFLRNLFAAPLELLMSPKRFIEDMWLESGRSRALLLGFPAVLIGLIGIVLIAMAQFGMSNLEASYVAALESVSDEKEKLEIDQFEEGRMKQVANGAGGEEEEPADPRAELLGELRKEEDIYLKKLISMNGAEPEYRFRLAMAKLRTNPSHGISILKDLAPDDTAGFSKAHRYLANYYANLRASTRAEASSNAGLALAHAEFCLKRNKNDKLAKAIKAQLLMNQGQLVDAYRLFGELFEEEPGFYRQLLQINERMDRKELNVSILDRALLSYNERLNREKLNNRSWVSVWQQMIGCYRELEDYKDAASLLTREIENLSGGGGPDDSAELKQTIRSRRVFLEKLLASVYLSWMGSEMAKESPGKAEKLRTLELAREAYRLASNNPEVLRMVARLATDPDPEISDAAKEIYNPFEHFGAPSPVLNELGAAAMQKGDFDSAVKFFELARKKEPENPMILNNLSYSWLRSNDEDASRALQLVDQGLRLIAGNARWGKYRSNFLDTRGSALIKLNRYEEAIAAFEQALTSRPSDIGLLQQLVECYREAGFDPNVLVNRIERLQNEEAAGN